MVDMTLVYFVGEKIQDIVAFLSIIQSWASTTYTELPWMFQFYFRFLFLPNDLAMEWADNGAVK